MGQSTDETAYPQGEDEQSFEGASWDEDRDLKQSVQSGSVVQSGQNTNIEGNSACCQ